MRVIAALDNIYSAKKDWVSYVTSRGGKVTVAPHNDEYDMVTRIHVHDPNQGNGIGSELLDMAKDHAAKRGRGLVLVPAADESEDQDRLVSFYKNRGFSGPDGQNFMRWRPES